MPPVRFIVTGLGSWGPGWAELIQQQDGVELAAVVEPMDDRRQAVVDARGLPPTRPTPTSNPRSTMSKPTPCSSSPRRAPISTSPASLSPPASRCSWKNRSPPPWTTPKPWSQLAEETGNLLIVSQNYRYRPPMQAVRKLLQDGVIGDILHIQANCQEDMRLFYEATNFRYLMPHPHIIDMTIHHWDLLRFLTGHEVDTVYATSWNIPDSPYQTDASCAIVLKLDDGTPVLYEGSSATHRDRTSWSSWWEFEGTKGRIWTDGGVGDPHLDTVHLHIYGEDPVIVDNITVAESDRHGSLLAFVPPWAVRSRPTPAATTSTPSPPSWPVSIRSSRTASSPSATY